MKSLTKQDFYNLLLTQGNTSIIKSGTQIYSSGLVICSTKRDLSEALKFSIVNTNGISQHQVILKSGKNGMINLCTCVSSKSGACEHIVAALLYMLNYTKRHPTKSTSEPESMAQFFYDKKTGSFKFQQIPYNVLDTFNQLFSEDIQHYIDEKLVKITQAEHKTCKADFIDKAVKYQLHFYLQNKNMVTACSCMSSRALPCLHKVVLLNLIYQKYGKLGLHAIIDKDKEYDRLLKPFGFDHNNYPKSVFKFIWKGNKIVLDFDTKSLISEKFIEKTSNNLELVDKTNQLDAITKVEAIKPAVEKLKLGYRWIKINDTAIEVLSFTGKTTKNGERFYSNYEAKGTDLMPGIDNEKTIAIQNIISKLNFVNNDFGFDNNYKYYYKADEVTEKLQHLNIAFPVVEELFEALKGEMNGYFKEDYPKSFKNYKPVALSDKRVDLKIEVNKKEELFEMFAKPVINDFVCSFDEIDTTLSQFYVLKNDVFYLHKNSAATSIFQMFDNRSTFHFFEKDFPKLYQKILQPAAEYFDVQLNFDFKINTVKEEMKAQIYLKELNNFLLLQPYVQYGDQQVELFSKNEVITIDNDSSFVKTERDELQEIQYQNALINLHPKFESQTDRGFFFLTVEELLKDGWFFDAFEKLKESGFEVFGQKELQKIKYNPNKPVVNFGVSSGIDWFEVDMKVRFGDTSVKLADVRKAFINEQSYVKLSDGTLGILPEAWVKKYEMMLKMGSIEKGDHLKLSKLHFSVLDQLFEDIDELEVQKEVHEKKKKLLSFTEIKNAKVPKSIKATLRPYQIKGYQWLNFVDEFNWGGILADDMGLGKTLQILTLLSAKQTKKKKLKALAVLPTTLIFNWENEIKKFCPHLTFHIHRGSKRAFQAEDLPAANIYLTSYGLMVNDIEWLKEIEFDYVILDESQAIKNPTSKRYKAARLLYAKNRLAMTGTPIENNTVDLFSQFNFVNPGFLGSLNFFKKEFANPIDKNGDVKKSDQLKKMIFPFLLRRTKEEVATDLPDKVEDIIYCEMDSAQRRVYDAFRNDFREKILNKIEEDGVQNSKIQVLAALTQLRLICNSPAILNTEENYGNASVKLDILMEHINEKTSNHKVLVFSQFVKMLSLIRTELDEAGLNYQYLDGQTSQKDRASAVSNFQKDEKCRVFLISLKAGGTGINLTAADYVYIVDPWWNPAVENQAIDRTHRIGQNKKVFAYRMICKNSIEEMILQLQEKKKGISKDIINSESGFMKKLTKNDIEALFS